INRGVTYWTDHHGDERIFFVAGSYLYALNAQTGKPISSFGHDGRVDLHEGLGRDVSRLFVTATSPGMIYHDLLIMGSRVDEGPAAAPGHIRAYDVRTGAIKWIFHTIPQPGEKGYDSWEDPEAWKHIGGANDWSGFSMDEKRGIVYAALGSASFDFYGGKRKGNNLFANCVVALDAATGKLRWYFQTIHHDVWDGDLPTPPTLVHIRRNGKTIAALAQPTKRGYLFLFDRVNGRPLYPIREIPVPHHSDLAGEALSPTQPVPMAPEPFGMQQLHRYDVNPFLPEASRRAVLERWRTLDSPQLFAPPSLRGVVLLPGGMDGGAEWGGAAYDPQTHWLYVNANRMAWIIQMIPLHQAQARGQRSYPEAGKQLYQQYCMSCHGADRKGGQNYPSLLHVNRKYDTTQFYALLNSGRRMMPSFSRLTAAEKRAIASFILQIPSLQSKPYLAQDTATDPYWNLPYTINGYTKFLSPEGWPAIPPPWGQLTAYNLQTGQIQWQIPLGYYPFMRDKDTLTGAENYGGPVVTASGLLFIAATPDGKIRALNKRTGKLLWQADLPAPAFATPAVYACHGKEYVVVACGGGKLNTPSGDAYVAFALPDSIR
ncbi:MAG: PQQ-binding-like beta-propeller repeat protein, partial [Thermoflavifilum sp.]|nr:PQQ-binding-like beta-propeller repeat protein [Thermoflavifilum sp.]